MKRFHVILALMGTIAAAACTGAGRQEPVENAAEDSVPAPTALPTTADGIEEVTVTAEPPSEPTAVPQATVAPTPTELSVAELLPVIESAPSWSNEVWINTETPLPLEDLRGKVVLLEFWTFG